MHRKFVSWACYKIVMAWTGQMPAAKWFMWMLARAGWYADYQCEDCIGMKDHGCYCKKMNAIQPGGPAA